MPPRVSAAAYLGDVRAGTKKPGLLLLDASLLELDYVDIDYLSYFGGGASAEIGPQRVTARDELEFVFRDRWRVRVLQKPMRLPQEWLRGMRFEHQEIFCDDAISRCALGGSTVGSMKASPPRQRY